jgi:site-specific DNA-methyltransferase (adenine-specific)
MSGGNMKPYYDDGKGIIIYHGNCLEVMAHLPDKSFNMVLTDPPWIARQKAMTRKQIKSNIAAKCYNPSHTISYGELGLFNQDALKMAFTKTSADMLVICGFKELRLVIETLEPIKGVFGWHKPNGGISIIYPAALDLAFIVWGAHKSQLTLTGFQHWRSSVFSVPTPCAGCMSNGERILKEKRGQAVHPAQGPIALYHQLLKPVSGSVLDPYLGTGTTLRAAKDLGLTGTGIEINEKYCEIAARRLEQEMLPFTITNDNNLWKPKPKKYDDNQHPSLFTAQEIP